MTETNGAGVPIIRRLKVEHFRGIESLVWYPEVGVNVLLGGGDVGKTTVLEAIALLLNPTHSTMLSDSDYWRREVEGGFFIEAVMSLPERCGINQQTRSVWPWGWDGKEPRLPSVDDDHAAKICAEPVYRLCVRGTPEFDLVYEVLQPDGTADHLSVAVRRRIGLVRLSGDDRNDRDLRLIQGSALDRLLSDKTLRSRLATRLTESDVNEELNADAKTRLSTLNESFTDRALPSGLGLGLTGGPGLSVSSLIGLTATKVKLPLASWGAGTRRLAALEIAAAYQGEHPIILVDEIERGLEPYRQRGLMTELHKGGSQVFITTHSAAALKAASEASLWYMDVEGAIGQLKGNVVGHLKRDPEMALARIAIIAEGPTEVGFVRVLLERAISNDLLGYGIWITDGCGNDHTLTLLEELVGSGLKVSGFADNEGRAPTKWKEVRDKLGNLLFQWPDGCTEKNVITLVSEHLLEDFIKDPEGDSGDRRRTLADRLDINEKEFSAIRTKAADLKALIIDAATGAIPDNMRETEKSEKKALRKHAERWFKSEEGGRELAHKVFRFDLWPEIKKQVLPFLNAVRVAVSLPEISELPS